MAYLKIVLISCIVWTISVAEFNECECDSTGMDDNIRAQMKNDVKGFFKDNVAFNMTSCTSGKTSCNPNGIASGSLKPFCLKYEGIITAQNTKRVVWRDCIAFVPSAELPANKCPDLGGLGAVYKGSVRCTCNDENDCNAAPTIKLAGGVLIGALIVALQFL